MLSRVRMLRMEHSTGVSLRVDDDRAGTFYVTTVHAAAKSFQSCPTLCDPVDGSPPESAVPGILQARALEWAAIAFSNSPRWSIIFYFARPILQVHVGRDMGMLCLYHALCVYPPGFNTYADNTLLMMWCTRFLIKASLCQGAKLIVLLCVGGQSCCNETSILELFRGTCLKRLKWVIITP